MRGLGRFQGIPAPRLLVGLFLCLILAACKPANTFKWTEDVLLPDGRTITLTRYQELRRPHGIAEDSGPSYHSLTFKNPGTGEIIRWEDPGDLGTVALLFGQNTPYLLVKPYYGSSIDKYQCPDPAYLLLRYQNHQWQRANLLELPVKRLRSNLTYGLDPGVVQEISAHARLSTSQTQASTLNSKPWLIDLSGLTQQTFGAQNCGRLPNDYIVSDSAH